MTHEPHRKFEAPGVTLYLGDARDILPMLPAGSIDFVFTDPPYGHNNNNNGDLISRREAALGAGTEADNAMRPIGNDGPEANELVRASFTEWRRLLSPGCCCCCCCGGGGPDPQFARWSLWLDEEIGFKQAVVWDKGPMGMGWHYRRSYELVLVGQVLGAACRWYDESSRVENIIRPGWRGASKIIPQKDDHPTPKPPELAAHFIGLHTLPCHTVLDPFMGGGSTALACIRMGRKFIGIEIEERWFDMACERIEWELSQPELFQGVAPTQ